MKQKGFTLIELLVVISIVALLSSVVLASLNSARDKAAIAAGKGFAQHLDSAISNQAVGWWDFDECSGTVAPDKSGYGASATLYNISSTWSSATPNNIGCSISFNGSSSYLDVAGSNSATSPLNITGSAITMSAWVYISGGSSARQVISKASGTVGNQRQYGMYVTGSGNALGCNIVTSTLYDQAIGSISVNVWHHIACVYDGAKAYHYLDGRLIGSNALTGSIVTQSANVTIGAFTTGPQSFFNGNMDRVRIIPSALVASEMQALYVSERPIFYVAQNE